MISYNFELLTQIKEVQMAAGIQGDEVNSGTARMIHDLKLQQEDLALRVENSKRVLRIELRKFKQRVVKDYAALVETISKQQRSSNNMVWQNWARKLKK